MRSLQSEAKDFWERACSCRAGLSTPAYVYDLEKIRTAIAAFRSEMDFSVRLFYATMANAHPEVVKVMAREGLGVFVNSDSHFQTAMAAGIPAQNIVFAGSGNTQSQMQDLAHSGCIYIADSLMQYQDYVSLSPTGEVGVRVNLGSLLGLSEQHDPAPRLGLTLNELAKSFVDGQGPEILHVYVGTNLLTPDLHQKALRALSGLARQYPRVTTLDLGGGFAFSPGEAMDRRMWKEILIDWKVLRNAPGMGGLRLYLEPGRSLVRGAGWFFVRITDVKERPERRYVLVDTSSTWYPRALLHEATDHYAVMVCHHGDGAEETRLSQICGSTTFSNDILAEVPLPTVRPGQILAFAMAGAYCQSMHLDFLGVAEPGIVWLPSPEPQKRCAEQLSGAVSKL